MTLLFQILGIVLALYTASAAVRGEVFTASGARGKSVMRDQTPRYFWIVIAIYAALSVLLLTVF